MDSNKLRDSLKALLSKDKAVQILVLAGFIGIVLIYCSTRFEHRSAETPTPAANEAAVSADYAWELEQGLTRIVTAITGEDSPAVFITLESDGETVYAADERSGEEISGDGNTRREKETNHVIMRESGGGENPLAVTRMQPKVKGVVIVSRYAGDPAVKEKLTDAARVALGVSSTKVCVTDTG